MNRRAVLGEPRLHSDNANALLVVGVLIAALITEGIGIHALFGAFLLGVLLSRRPEIERGVGARFGGLTQAVLLPVFFANIGLRTKIGLLESTQDWVLCGLIIVLASAGKIGAPLDRGAVRRPAARRGGGARRTAQHTRVG
jgi:Kef-type K+ transport system membrane component KefB